MSVITTYDEMRENLKNKLTECLDLAREMLDEDIWGYKDMKKGYALEVYLAVMRARDSV